MAEEGDICAIDVSDGKMEEGELDPTEAEEGEYVEGEEGDEGEYVEETGNDYETKQEEESLEQLDLSTRDLHHDQWDDTALIEAWDAAVREYQMYHSDNPPTGGTKKRKRDKKSVSKEAKASETPNHSEDHKQTGEKAVHGTQSAAGNYSATYDSGAANSSANGAEGIPQTYDQTYQQGFQEAGGYGAHHSQTYDASVAMSAVPPMPEDEDLANMMMSWYYAGYYSGIYNAKQQRQQQASK